ncbi:MAG: MBL fold metallo-hydrolase [Hymenobacteraceae bacterium]|nr:MBL fold metallo-hydrolase [Hymenobacteraceae bacterium]
MLARRHFLRLLGFGATAGLLGVNQRANARSSVETLLKNDHLPVVLPGWAGNRLVGRQFVNADGTVFESKFSTLLAWQLQRNPQREEKKNDTWAPPVQALSPDLLVGTAPAAQDALVWLGHATWLIQWGGRRVLTDPVFFNVSLVKRRHALPFPDPAQLRNLDVVFFSHGHRDHLDERSVKIVLAANPRAVWLTPLRMAPLLTAWGVPAAQIQEAGWWQSYDLPGAAFPLTLTFLPAQHWHRRGLADMNRVLWGSLLIQHHPSNRTLWFAGDTAWGPHFQQIADHFGPLDYALLPIGAYKPRFMMSAAHISPPEAIKAFNLLRAETFLPMHHGTFDLSDEPAAEPLRVIEQLAASGGLSAGQRLVAPAVGAATTLT